eukprot:NODE_65_length_25825_cov_1.353844.p10 type:complete len:264 gc:universal NODE_65_length_25825_cov_1.353844:845-1636(+)
MAIILTYVLIFKYIIEAFTKGPQPLAYYYPLIMFLIVLFLPGVLVMLTRREVEYVAWMFYYLTVGLPIWNFVLPLYAYWKMDEFSWGKTRTVEGGEGEHGSGKGQFDPRSITTKRLKEWNETGFYDEFLNRRRQGKHEPSVNSEPQSATDQSSFYPPSQYGGSQSHLNYNPNQYQQPYYPPQGQPVAPTQSFYGQPQPRPYYPPSQQDGLMYPTDSVSQISSNVPPPQAQDYYYQTSPTRTQMPDPQFYDLNQQPRPKPRNNK